MNFSEKLFTGLGLGFQQGQHPGTVLFLMAGVQIGVLRLAGLNHLPKDFQQSLAQATQGTRMAFAFRAFLFVIDFGPGTNPHAALGPKMDRVTQNLVALVAHADSRFVWSGGGCRFRSRSPA